MLSSLFQMALPARGVRKDSTVWLDEARPPQKVCLQLENQLAKILGQK